MTGQIEHLVKMAHQIALNFSDWGDQDLVVAKTGEHLQKFWTPAMLHQLLEYWRSDSGELSPVVCSALASIEENYEKGEPFI